MRRAGKVKLSVRIGAALIVTALTGGCAVFGDKAEGPAWFDQKVAQLEDQDYPRLGAVPEETKSALPDAEWARIETELRGAGAALAANPRSAPASATTASGEFETQARREAEAPRPER
jgi:hypothetical protein